MTSKEGIWAKVISNSVQGFQNYNYYVCMFIFAILKNWQNGTFKHFCNLHGFKKCVGLRKSTNIKYLRKSIRLSQKFLTRFQKNILGFLGIPRKPRRQNQRRSILLGFNLVKYHPEIFLPKVVKNFNCPHVFHRVYEAMTNLIVARQINNMLYFSLEKCLTLYFSENEAALKAQQWVEIIYEG